MGRSGRSLLRTRAVRCSAAAVVALAAGAGLSSAVAATSHASITGTWSVTGPSPLVAQQWTISESTSGSLSGEGTGSSGPFATISGSVSGSSVTVVTTYTSVSYTATFTGTVSADGTTMSGTWSDTNGLSGESWSATTTPKGRASFTQVICNLDFTTGLDACGANVADASGNPSPITPTGTVTFASQGGGALLGSVCTLQQTPYSPGVASCTVQYRPPNTSTFPQIVARYGGDTNLQPSVGATSLLAAALAAEEEQVCDDGCDNLQIDYLSDLEPGQDLLSLTEDVPCAKTAKTGRQAGVAETSCPAPQPECPAGSHWSIRYGTCVSGNDIRVLTEADMALGKVNFEEMFSLPTDDPDLNSVLSMHRWTALRRVQAAIYNFEQKTINSKVTTASKDFQNWQDYVNGNTSSNASSLQQADQMTAPAFPAGSSTPAPAGQSRDLLDTRTATAAHAEADPATSTGTGPKVSLVLAAVTAKHPTATDARAFDEELILANSPTYSPARAVARVSLLVAAKVGVLTIARDLGLRRLSQLTRIRRFKIAAVKVKLRAGRRTRIVLSPTSVGKRMLRVLELLGLSHKGSITLTVSERPGRRTLSVTRPIRVR